MSRPVDWAPLASSDPVPGDPDRVGIVAAKSHDLATLLEQQAEQLRALSSGQGWDADAGGVFARSAAELAGHLDKARRRYSVVAEALRGYAPVLRHAQSEADAARSAAKEAQQRVDAVVSTSTSATRYPGADQAAEQARRSAHDAASADLDRARRRLAAAVRDRDVAASLAQRRVREVIDNDGLKDSFWDKAKDWAADRWDASMAWIHEHAAAIKFIADLCGTIATVLSLIAIVISFIPVLDFLSPILMGAAVVLTGVAALCHLALALSGDGSWLDLGLDVFALVTFGYGRSAAAGLKAARGAVTASTKTALTNAARREAEPLIRTLSRQLGSRTTRAAVRRGARAQLNALKREASRRAAATAQRLGRQELPVLRRALYVDGQLARVAGGTKAMLRAVEGNRCVRPQDLNSVRAAAGGVSSRVTKLALSAGTAVGVDLADRGTTLTFPNGHAIDLDGPLPDKGSVFDGLKPALTWGRYSSGR